MTRWLDPSPVQITDSLKALGLAPLVLETLVRRGFTDGASARSFLHPGAVPPVPFPGIDKAADLVRSAIGKKDRVCIWGDFDVDGQTSTTLLVQTLRALGADVVSYIPVRAREGHGVHIASLEPIIESGAKLLLTCDTGITAHEAINYAKSRGLEVVVTDHHDPGEILPAADVIVNPKLLPEGSPLADLAGVGVAYKLAESLLSDGGGSGLEDILDLVALGLIADVAVLRAETRSLAQRGIHALRNTRRLGLKVMAEMSGTNLETLTEETIGFTFGPRLNALGRLSDANPAVELLLTHDPTRANVLAAQIEGLNAQRRLLTSQVYEGAEALLRANPGLLAEPAIVLVHPNWPGGVVGIVASRLVERYHKPAILLTGSEDGILRGSARSVEGLHITRAISSQSKMLLGFGGHPMAAGLSLEAGNLNGFRKGLARAIESQLGQEVLEEPALEIDAWLSLGEPGLELAEAVEILAPFGAGNPPLVFASRAVKMKSASVVGKAREHLRLLVEDEAARTQSIMWWNGADEELPEDGRRFDVAYALRAATFRGQRQLSLEFVDMRLLEEERPPEIRPRAIEVIDLRAFPEPGRRLDELRSKMHELEVWAEGSEREQGRARFELQAAKTFAIYTLPPSARELRDALRITRPERVYLFAVSGGPDQPDDYLSRLAGLCKYAINQRGGRTTLHQLAAACAQRTTTVRLGLEWLRAGGHISFQGESSLELTPGSGEPDKFLQNEFYLAVRDILMETASYRTYYATAADPDRLIDG